MWGGLWGQRLCPHHPLGFLPPQTDLNSGREMLRGALSSAKDEKSDSCPLAAALQCRCLWAQW